jgi:hypothetical protein
MYRAPSGTAFSVNIEELPNFFWALLDVGVNLVANALHIPVPLARWAVALRPSPLKTSAKCARGTYRRAMIPITAALIFLKSQTSRRLRHRRPQSAVLC